MRQILLAALTLSASMTVVATAQAQGRPQIVLYQEDNFRGNQLALDGDASRLGDRHFDDRASSVRVLSGRWDLCQEDRFGGRCVTVDRDVAKLGAIGMDDRISSVRLIEDHGDDRQGRQRRR